MPKQLILFLLLTVSGRAYSGMSEMEIFFECARISIIEMQKSGEIEDYTPHGMMRDILKLKGYSYECAQQDFANIYYDECVTKPMIMRLPDDRTGGFATGAIVGGAASRIAERVYDRVIDRGLDHVERRVEKFKKDREAMDKRERERRATERERNTRCVHSVPSFRDGGCP